MLKVVSTRATHNQVFREWRVEIKCKMVRSQRENVINSSNTVRRRSVLREANGHTGGVGGEAFFFGEQADAWSVLSQALLIV